MTKVLCLHGWGGSADLMKLQMKSFASLFPDMQFEYISGPIKLTEVLVGDPALVKAVPNKKFYSWKLNIYDEVISGKQIDIEESINFIIDYMNKNGPFDGLCGFSMGGAFVEAVIELSESGELKDKLKVAPPKFGMFFCSNYCIRNQNLLKTPSIHFYGPNDFIVDASCLISTRFLNPLVITIGENHRFPKLNENELSAIRKYLAAVIGKNRGTMPKPKL